MQVLVQVGLPIANPFPLCKEAIVNFFRIRRLAFRRRGHHMPFLPPRAAARNCFPEGPVDAKRDFDEDAMRDEALRDEGFGASAVPRFSVMGREYRLPQSRAQRIAIGVALIFFGILGFLPVLGFWMIPLGLLVLSYEFAAVRRWRRRTIVWWHRRRAGRAAQEPGGSAGPDEGRRG
jgi:hypothetical protein